MAREAWAHAKAVIQAGEYQLVVLDEITYPMTWGWIDTDDVVATIRDRPEKVNVVATGRDAPTGADRRRRHRHRDAQDQARVPTPASSP